MKKLTQSAFTGGAPFYKSDLREVFNDEIWDAVEAFFSPFNSDTQGIIVSGCVITANVGTPANFDMTAGIVYLNGEFMRIAAVTNQTFTKYIVPSTPVLDSRTLADGNVHNVTTTTGAELSASAPGSGQYITISSLTSADSRRWGRPSFGDTINLVTKVFQIGDWNMDTTDYVDVTHNIGDKNKIRMVYVTIRNDAGTNCLPLDYGIASDTTRQGMVNQIQNTTITLGRKVGGGFDASDHSATSYNRGWVTIIYEA